MLPGKRDAVNWRFHMLVAMPPLAVALMMLRYALDFPMLDQWELVPLLQDW